MEIIVAAAAIGLLPAMIAHRKGRPFVLWWVFGAILFIVALPLALYLSPDRIALDARATSSGEMKKCLHCGELIRTEAKVCKHCGRDI